MSSASKSRNKFHLRNSQFKLIKDRIDGSKSCKK